MTNGLFHTRGAKRKRKSSDDPNGKKTKPNSKCSGIRENCEYSSYCGSCYRAQDKHLSSVMRKKHTAKKVVAKVVIHVWVASIAMKEFAGDVGLIMTTTPQ